MENYIIVDKNCIVTTYHKENVKNAICEYAKNCGITILLDTFAKAVQNLEIIEIIELFNNVCLSNSDKIERIFTGYTTLYDAHK